MEEYLQKTTRFGRIIQNIKNVLWFKRLCQECKTMKTGNADENGNPICDDCYHKLLLLEAKTQNPDILKCPKCSTEMELGIIIDAKNTVFHQCTKEGCHTMVLDQRTLRGITILHLDCYPEHLGPPEHLEPSTQLGLPEKVY
ncbi:MAG: hypothetical protein WCP92_03890 [bacterium]